MSVTTGGSFPGGSYLAGAMPSDEQVAVAREREAARIERRQREQARAAAAATEPHAVRLGMDGATFRPMWTCSDCGESQRDFSTGEHAAESARQHAGPNGTVST